MPNDNRTQGPSNQGRRNPLDDLLTDAELRAESHKAATRFGASDARVKRHMLRTTPVSVIAMAAVLLVGFGVWIGGQFSRRDQPEARQNNDVRNEPQSLFNEWNKDRTDPGIAPGMASERSAGAASQELTSEVVKSDDREHLEQAPPVSVMTPKQVSQKPTQQESKALYDRASAAVVRVNVLNSRSVPIGHGSGFFVGNDTTVVTNFHVIDHAYSVEVVLRDGTSLPVLGVQKYDETSDVAVLKVSRGVNSEISPLTLGPSTPPPGSTVYLIGSPKGLDYTVTLGKVSNDNREMKGGKWIQIDVSTSSGSSGSPVLSEDGFVVGIHSFAILGAENQKFAAPAAAIASLIVENPPLQQLSDLIREKKQILNSAQEKLDAEISDSADDATRILNGLRESFQDLPDYWILKGAIYSQRAKEEAARKQWEAALQYWEASRRAFSGALAVDQQYSHAWYRIGMTYQDQNRRLRQQEEAVAAVNAFRNGTEANPSDADCWRGLGISLNSLRFAKKPKEAADALRRCLTINPQDCWAHAALGDALAELGDIEGGLAAYKTALTMKPDDYVCNFDYGYFLRRNERYNEAIKAFETALMSAKDSKTRRASCEEELQKTRKLIR